MWLPSTIYHWVRNAGHPTQSRLSRWEAMADKVIKRSDAIRNWSDQELRRHAREIRWQAKTGIPLASLLQEAFAMVREASRRTTGKLHYPVQIMGGIALFEGQIVEMHTGEGKTLTATLPTFLRALPGLGTHVITVNDYLAERDSELNGEIYKVLGLTVGCILTPMETDERREAYTRDVTYGTAKEMGFDFLRDRLRLGAGKREDTRHAVFDGRKIEGEQTVQRGHHFALIDEADSILIDEARTPLIIGLTMPNDAATVNLLRWSHRATRHFEANKDFIYEPDRRTAYLTDAGCRRVLLLSKPSLLDTIDTERIYTNVEQAITAKFAFERDRDYVIVEDEIVIVDESTGRLMDGRKWQDGLHQAVEAKELVPITAATGQAARITIQDFFRQYTHLAGMTGTAVLARRELKRIYHVKVTQIPTNKPCIRHGLPSRVFATREAKRDAIVEEIARLNKAGRAVLIGTPSVEASELLGAALAERSIPHKTLNARYHEIEADIVADAGKPGKVTIATNMAGRGTDILLEPEVQQNGGLHVIATEMHTSARIDRQLIGRAARQGDPGSFQFFLSLDDELLRCLTPEARQKLRDQASPNKQGELGSSWLPLFHKTQRFLEKLHVKQRKMMLRQEKERNKLYRQMGLDPYLELTE
jgi:preprotein translocase subunit SecA